MSIAVAIRGAPKQISVSTAAELFTAYAQARGGEVITLTQVVPSFTWTLNVSKPRTGVCVVLPAGQPLRLLATARNLNTEIVGGYFTAPVMAGGTEEYAIYLSGCSHLWLRGGTIGTAGAGLVGTQTTDFGVYNTLAEWQKADCIALSLCARFEIKNFLHRDGPIRGYSIRVFDNGTAPTDSTSSGSVPNSAWYDSAHSDLMQIRNNSHNYVIEDVEADYNGTGIVNYYFNGKQSDGLPADLKCHHWRISRCTVRSPYIGLIFAIGDHGTLTDCHVASHPTLPDGVGTRTLALERHGSNDWPAIDNTGNKLRSGGCTSTGTISGVAATATSAASDPSRPDVNGDPGTEEPVIPVFNRLPWAPAAPTPAHTPYTGLADVAGEQYLFSGYAGVFSRNPSTTPVGAYLTSGLGFTKGVPTSRQFQWKRNGVVVAGTHGNRVLATAGMSAGDVVLVEQRTTNGAGTTGWVPSKAVTLV